MTALAVLTACALIVLSCSLVEVLATRRESSALVNAAELGLEATLAEKRAPPKIIDTAEACRSAVDALLEEEEIAVDLEGVDLGRSPGRVCILQVCGSDGTTYLFDITTLQESAFDSGLRELLESQSVRKVFYDVRADADALLHNHGVRMQSTYDLQVLFHAVFFPEGRATYLKGFKTALEMYAQLAMPPDAFTMLKETKEVGHRLFDPVLGGTYEVWDQRPLLPVLVRYCATDVEHLLKMKAFWNSSVPCSIIEDITRARIERFTRLNYRSATMDFSIPDDLQGIPVPRGYLKLTMDIRGFAGKVIGRRGGTIRRLEEDSRAFINVEDNQAEIIGSEEAVHKAQRYIQDLLTF